MTRNDLSSDDLLHQIEETARAQNRQPKEIVSDAVRKYLDEQKWVQFVSENERRVRAKGIREEDVDRFIAEVRHEEAQRGR